MKQTPLHIGLVNIMPKAYEFEPQLYDALADPGYRFAFHPIRLETHQYLSSAGNISHYRTFDQVLAGTALDMLIITGAPVENLDFRDIHYWPELSAIIARCVATQVPLMGICFGGLALLHTLGVEKEVCPEKQFGVASLTPGSSARARQILDRPCHMAVATKSLPRRDSLAPMLGRGLHAIAESAEYGPLVLASDDMRMYVVLGHPEYRPQCVYDEWLRDKANDLIHTRRLTTTSVEQMMELMKQPCTNLLTGWVRHWALARAQAGRMPTTEVAATA